MQVSAEQKKLFRKNISALKKFNPELSTFLDADIPSNVELYQQGDDLDILINGSRFYGEDARIYAGKQVELFLASPTMSEINPFSATEDRTPTHVRLQEGLNSAFGEEHIHFSQTRLRIDAATTCVFGIGLGFHILPIIIETQCREIILMEPEPVFFVLSMYFIDWAKIIKYMKREIVFIFDRDADHVLSSIQSRVQPRNVGVQQALFYIRHYSSEYLLSSYNHFASRFPVLFEGLGFYDDEKVMTRNCLLNLYMSQWKMCSIDDERQPGTAVIVGAGPSLDNDIDWIKDHREEFILFSGGSALPTLLRNGITPDFHVEIENVAMNYDLLSPLVNAYDLSKVILVCSSTMDTRSAYLFKRRIWFLREAVSSSYLFDVGYTTALNQNPTVVNTATSTALSLGFRVIYLLGADFGTLDPKVHHSKDSFYDYHEDLKKVEFKFPEQAKGNFGGKAYLNQHFKGGLFWMKNLAERYKGASFFNGSNGVAIPKFVPVKASRFKLVPMKIEKEMLIDRLYKNVRVEDWEEKYGLDMFENLKVMFSEYIAEMRDSYKKIIRRKGDFIKKQREIYIATHSVSEKYAPFNPMIAGTINTQTMLLMYWWRRTPLELLPRYERVACKQWLKFLDVIEKDFDKFIDTVRQELPLVRTDLFDDNVQRSLDKV